MFHPFLTMIGQKQQNLAFKLTHTHPAWCRNQTRTQGNKAQNNLFDSLTASHSSFNSLNRINNSAV